MKEGCCAWGEKWPVSLEDEDNFSESLSLVVCVSMGGMKP